MGGGGGGWEECSLAWYTLACLFYGQTFDFSTVITLFSLKVDSSCEVEFQTRSKYTPIPMLKGNHSVLYYDVLLYGLAKGF